MGQDGFDEGGLGRRPVSADQEVDAALGRFEAATVSATAHRREAWRVVVLNDAAFKRIKRRWGVWQSGQDSDVSR